MRQGHSIHRITLSAIAKAKAPSVLIDGNGLRLVINSTTSCSWMFRDTYNGQNKNLGLGSYPSVDLEEARATAETLRKQLRAGKDLVAERAAIRGTKITFREAFNVYWEKKKKTLSNGKHIRQWTSTMETHAFPKIGERPIADITPDEIMAVIDPIWHELPETAGRTLQRIRAVFETAIFLNGLHPKAS